MDPTSTALTVAWLDAFRRAQSADLQRFLQKVPQAQPSRADRTLTDVIQSAITAGGAGPQQVAPVDATPDASPHVVDRLA
ncbi:MAG TPA: hypothetical protein VHA77_05055 [Xanthobacteraceae bacterium]|jgi:hypothetical protein|nr:hypothetical protein [Xanthobacteraceae bacterium]